MIIDDELEWRVHHSQDYEAPFVNIDNEYLESVPTLKVEDLNPDNTTYKYQKVVGAIKKIGAPRYYHDRLLHCSNCGTYHGEYDSINVHANMATCPRCHYHNDIHNKTCKECGKKLTYTTSKNVLEGANFICRKCKTIGREIKGELITRQEIIISNENSYIDLEVSLHVEKPLNKNDVGKPVQIIGNIEFNEITNKCYTETGNYNFIKPNEDEKKIFEQSRDIPGYEDWRKEVLQRDQKCIVCDGDKHLEAHHMYGYKQYPELRTDLNNGVTVCKFCHDKYHSYYGVKDITPLKFVKFMKRFGL